MRALAPIRYMQALVLCAVLLQAGAVGREAAAEVRRLERQLMVCRLIAGLELERGEMRELLALCEEVEALVPDYIERAEELVERQRTVFARFLEEAKRNQGFTPELERSTGNLDHQGLELRKELLAEIDRVATRAAGILGQARVDRLERALTQVRERRRRRGSQGDDRVADTAQQLAELHAARVGELRPVGFLLVSEGTASYLRAHCGRRSPRRDMLAALVQTPFINPFDLKEGGDAELERLRGAINLTNLINGLHLTEQQTRDILRAHRSLRHRPPQERPGITCETRAGRRYRDALEDAIRDLERGRTVSEREIRSLRWQRQEALRAERPAERPQPDAARALDAAAEAVAEALTDEQASVLVDYQPCIIPPEDLNNPVRAGQASDGSRFESVLDRMRGIPEAAWRRERDRILEHMVGMSERRYGALEPDERRRALDRLGSTLDKAREMSDLEYRLSRTELAGELAFMDRHAVLAEQLTALRGEEQAACDKIRIFLLDPDIVPLLEERLD